MKWKQDLEALIESTMALTKDVKHQPIQNLPIALTAVEQALFDTPKTVPPPAAIATDLLPGSERDEIRKRINNFKAHQEKIAREREEYYQQVKTKMMTPPFVSRKKNLPD
jgi:hypothetical protein